MAVNVQISRELGKVSNDIATYVAGFKPSICLTFNLKSDITCMNYFVLIFNEWQGKCVDNQMLYIDGHRKDINLVYYLDNWTHIIWI